MGHRVSASPTMGLNTSIWGLNVFNMGLTTSPTISLNTSIWSLNIFFMCRTTSPKSLNILNMGLSNTQNGSQHLDLGFQTPSNHGSQHMALQSPHHQQWASTPGFCEERIAQHRVHYRKKAKKKKNTLNTKAKCKFGISTCMLPWFTVCAVGGV